MANVKRLAKNTLFMYIRMILIMVVSIYTSRVILDKLGVDDYGIYNAVASVVAMTAFLTSTLTTSSSRFINYALGSGDKEKQRNTFSTVFYTHVLLAVILVVILETLGLWYLHNKFVIPPGRELAVSAIFQISILNIALTVVNVPYLATITAHEQMNIYAYVGIYEVFAKLGVVYLLSIAPIDRLIFYALLLLGVQVTLMAFNILYCLNKNTETQEYRKFNKKILHEVLGFSGWTLIANLCNTLVVQGPTILLNLFAAPAIIASRALATQITHAIMLFVSNFRTALNPQIIKSYAAGEHESSKRLTMYSTLIVFDMLLLLGLPCIFTMKTIMGLWLVDVPPLAVQFTQIAILAQIVGSISSSTYMSFVASGRIKILSLISIPTSSLFFIILYLILKMGGSPLWTQWLYLILILSGVLIIRPVLFMKVLKYEKKDYLPTYWNCFKVLASSTFLSIILYKLLSNSLAQQAILFVSVIMVVLICSYVFMDKAIKSFAINIVKTKLKIIKK